MISSALQRRKLRGGWRPEQRQRRHLRAQLLESSALDTL